MRTGQQGTIVPGIENIIKSYNPTFVAAALRALSVMLDTRQPNTNFQQVVKMMNHINNALPIIWSHPICCEDFATFFINLLSHPMNKQSPSVFCEKVKQALLDNQNKGSFGYSLSYVTLLAQRDSSLISKYSCYLEMKMNQSDDSSAQSNFDDEAPF